MSDTFSKVAGQYKVSIGVFHVFKIAQMTQNREKNHIHSKGTVKREQYFDQYFVLYVDREW